MPKYGHTAVNVVYAEPGSRRSAQWVIKKNPLEKLAEAPAHKFCTVCHAQVLRPEDPRDLNRYMNQTRCVHCSATQRKPGKIKYCMWSGKRMHRPEEPLTPTVKMQWARKAACRRCRECKARYGKS